MDKLRHLLAQVAHQVIAELPDAAGRPGRRVTDAVSVARVETDMGRRADQLVVVDAVQVGVTRDTARPSAEEVSPFGHGRTGIDIILVRAEVLDRRNATFVLDRPELAGLAEAVGLLGVPAGVPEAWVRVGEEADALGLKFPDAVARLVDERVVRPVSAMSVCGRDDPRDKCRRHVKIVAQIPNRRLAPLRQVQVDNPQWILHEPCRRIGTRKGLRVPRGGRLQELAVDLPGLKPAATIRLQHATSARPEAPRPRSPCLARRADEILQRQLSVDAGRHVALGQAFRIFGAEVNAVAPVVVIADELHRGPVLRIPAAHLVADRRVSGDHPAELRLDQRVVSRQLRKARLREDGPANATAPRIIRLQASLDAIPFQANVLPNREARARARDDKAVLPELGARANAARAGAHSPRNAILPSIFEFPPEAVLDKQRVTCQTVPGAKNRISRNGPLRNRHHEPRRLQEADVLLRLTPGDSLRRIPSAEPSVPAAGLRKEIGDRTRAIVQFNAPDVNRLSQDNRLARPGIRDKRVVAARTDKDAIDVKRKQVADARLLGLAVVGDRTRHAHGPERIALRIDRERCNAVQARIDQAFAKQPEGVKPIVRRPGNLQRKHVRLCDDRPRIRIRAGERDDKRVS